MKALYLMDKGDIRVLDAPVPVPGAGNLLIRTKASTICTSDINDMRENPFNIPLPIILGHEGAGVVEAVGEGVTGFDAGDAVTAHPVMPCCKCVSCIRGLPHLCDNMEHLGLTRGGTFAEYFTIRADRARKKPGSLSFAESTLMEPVCVCLEALERADVREGGNVLIVGDGPFGVMMAALCRHCKPARVTLLGRHRYRMERARGVTAINERQSGDVIGDIMKASDGLGYDSAILCVGTQAAMDICVEALRSRGTLCVFSALTGKPGVDLFKVHVKELNIKGSCNDMDKLDEALSLLCDRELGLASVITHTVPFADVLEAFALASGGKDRALKVSVTFD